MAGLGFQGGASPAIRQRTISTRGGLCKMPPASVHLPQFPDQRQTIRGDSWRRRQCEEATRGLFIALKGGLMGPTPCTGLRVIKCHLQQKSWSRKLGNPEGFHSWPWGETLSVSRTFAPLPEVAGPAFTQIQGFRNRAWGTQLKLLL